MKSKVELKFQHNKKMTAPEIIRANINALLAYKSELEQELQDVIKEIALIQQSVGIKEEVEGENE